jgi:hypothetical protein
MLHLLKAVAECVDARESMKFEFLTIEFDSPWTDKVDSNFLPGRSDERPHSIREQDGRVLVQEI